MTRAVTVQTTRVEISTSTIPQQPSSEGVEPPAAAWAMAEEPRPASLVNTPPGHAVAQGQSGGIAPKSGTGAKGPLKDGGKGGGEAGAAEE